VCYFRWRQAPMAQEQMHAGLLRPDSAPAPGLAEAEQVAQDLSALGEVDAGPSQAAIVFDYPSAWAWDIQPQGADFDYFRLVFDAYKAMRRHGLNIDILPSSTRDFSSYEAVFVPGLMTLPDGLLEALKEVQTVYGPRTDSKTDTMSIPTPLGPNVEGLDATVAFTESLPPQTSVLLKDGGAFHHWFEHVETTHPSTWETQTGVPALVSSERAHYLAGWPDEVAWDRLVDAFFPGHTRLLEGLRTRATSTHRFWINYRAEEVTHGGVTVPGAGVIWQTL